MSRIGRNPIPVPSGVTIELTDGHVKVTGPKGTLERDLPRDITVRQDADQLLVERPTDQRQHRALHGLTRSLVNNMVVGVTDGFTRDLEIVGVGYRAAATTPGQARPGPRLQPPGLRRRPRGHHLRDAGADQDHRPRHRQGSGRPGGRQHPQPPQARALQGQGRPLRRRGRPPQGRKGSEVSFSTKKKQLARTRRHHRVRKLVRGTAERPRLAVFRSNKHITAQVIDDVAGRTLAAASTVRGRPAVGPHRQQGGGHGRRHAGGRAGQGRRRHQGRLRPGRQPLPRPGRRSRRRGPRSRIGVLRYG